MGNIKLNKVLQISAMD